MDKWSKSEFLDIENEPLGPLANLVDVVLVFVCGLIAALVTLSPDLQEHFSVKKVYKDVLLGKELAQTPSQMEEKTKNGDGYESLGNVYRDPKTGKLILISK